MQEWLLSFLRCSFCSGPIRQLMATKTQTGAISYGVLNCPVCSFDYPVVAGVVILRHPDATLDTQRTTSEKVTVSGPRVRDVCRVLKNGKNSKALELLLNPLALDGPVIPRSLKHRRSRSHRGPITQAGGLKGNMRQKALRLLESKNLMPLARTVVNALMAPKRAAKKGMLPIWRKRIRGFLEGDTSELSAIEAIDLYYREYSGSEAGIYFAYRFAQPRHLAGLCIGSALLESDGLILDLACGAGHLSHFFSYGRSTPRVVGLDRDFFSLYVAKNLVAPSAEFILGEADASLPFANGSFTGVLCSDAFSFFLRRVAAVREMARVARPDSLIAVTRTRNSAAEPRESYELSVEGYRTMFSNSGLQCAVFSERTLVKQYLSRDGLDLTWDDSANLEDSEWLTVFASQSQAPFRRYASWTEWPHAVGRLALNPLYVRESRKGEVELTLRFPSDWYKHQNETFLEYAPQQCTIPEAVVTAIEAGQRPPEAQPFIDRFTIIGMPDRYTRV